MFQSKTNNQKPHILLNHTLENNRAYGKYRVGVESSNPTQVCKQNTNKKNKNAENNQHR